MSEFIKLYNENVDERKIKHIVEELKKGAIIIYPTDTVYGLGCDFTNSKAVEKLAKIKNISVEKANFSFICYDLSNISLYSKQIDNSTFKLLKRTLPGPFTYILPASKELPKYFKDKKSVGIRVPDNVIARSIVKELGNPIISTSVYSENVTQEYLSDPELIYEKMKKYVDIVIDGGAGNVIASTVVDLTDGDIKILRQGAGILTDF